MSAAHRILAAKSIALCGFLVLLVVTYWLRSEVLGMSRIRFSADQKQTELEARQHRESYADRQRQYEIGVKNYETQLKHYERMMEIYERDFDEYTRLAEKSVVPPQLPARPSAPRSPEVEDEFQSIRAEFVARRYRFFVISETGNWIACAGALALVGGLLYLLLFDVDSNRLYYFMVLGLSFVFLIGPSMHSILSAFIGMMHAPYSY